MSRRGDRVIAFMLAFSVGVALSSVVLGVIGNVEYACYAMGLACFSVLLSIYLEVYSRRG